MDLSISVVSWNTRDVLDECLRSVYEETCGIDFEVVVVDNASSDGSACMVRDKYPQAILRENVQNIGFARANNQAYTASRGRYFLLLNPDTLCKNNSLTLLVRFLDSNHTAGVAGPMVLNSDGTLQYSWARFPTFWSEVGGLLDRRIVGLAKVPRDVEQVRAIGVFETDWVGGCCMMVRRDAIEEVGTMDESFFMYCEETDWCMRLKANGWHMWVEPCAEIVHLGGQSSVQASGLAAGYLRASKAAFFAKHHGRMASAMLALALGARSQAARMIRGSK